MLQTSCCWPDPGGVFIIFCSCKLQQDKCYFLFCSFLSLYESKTLLALKVKPGKQSIAKYLLCVFQAIGNILLQRSRASMTKHKQQSTHVRAKGIDSMWSQVCFFYYTNTTIWHIDSLRNRFFIKILLRKIGWL